MFRLLTLFVSLAALRVGVVMGTINCKMNDNCLVPCSTNATCNSQRINCPTSNTTRSYTCTVLCSDAYSCFNTMIESGNGVSILSVQSLVANASRGLEIKATGTNRVELTCTGVHSCDELSVEVSQSKSVLITVNGTSATKLAYGTSNANLTINNTNQVSINCVTDNACYGHSWMLFGNDEVTLTCNGNEACYYNHISLYQSSQATIQVISGYASIQQNKIVVDKVDSLIIQSPDNGIQNGFNTLRNVYRFLLNISGTGNALGALWQATNVSHVALNSWNATSHWLVYGSPINSVYPCPPNKDCIIRVEETLNSSQPITIACPKVNQTGFTPKCIFYCTATITGCSTIQLFATNSPDVTLFLDTPQTSGFLLNADATELDSNKKMINITCSSTSSCYSSSFYVSGFTDVILFCDSHFSCEAAEFNISKFSNAVNILANSFAMHEAKLSLDSGNQVLIAPYDTADNTNGQTFRYSKWFFHKISNIFLYCSSDEDCEEIVVTSTAVKEFLVTCGSFDHTSTHSCVHSNFRNNANSSFNLLCIGDYSCWNVEVEYDGNEMYDTSCSVACQLNENAIEHATCGDMTVTVQNNQIGYKAIDLSCEATPDFVSCYNVSVICGENGLMCNCPVSYDDSKNSWLCDGKCGTAVCEKDKSSSKKLSAGATTGIVLSVLVVIGVLGYFTYQYVKSKRVESHLLSPSDKNTGTSVQTGYKTYQNL